MSDRERVAALIRKHAQGKHDQKDHGNWARGGLYHITSSQYWEPEDRGGGTVFLSDAANLKKWADRVDWGGSRKWVIELRIKPEHLDRYKKFLFYDVGGGGIREAQVQWDHLEVVRAIPKEEALRETAS